MGTLQKARRLFKNVRTAPKEVAAIVDILDEFETLLVAIQGLVEKQSTVGAAPNSFNLVKRALQRCTRTTSELDASIGQPLNRELESEIR